MAKRILFVCSGNTCRSPMAEALLKHLLAKRGGALAVTVMSAGLKAYGGEPAMEGAREAIREEDLDLSGHRSRRVTPILLEEADLVLTMTATHRDEITSRWPHAAAGKIFTLKEFAGADPSQLDIADPFGASGEIYRACAATIRATLASSLDLILSFRHSVTERSEAAVVGDTVTPGANETGNAAGDPQKERET